MTRNGRASLGSPDGSAGYRGGIDGGGGNRYGRDAETAARTPDPSRAAPVSISLESRRIAMLSPEELARLTSAESLFPSPIPVQSVSSDEFMPGLQTPRQREFEARVKDLGTRLARRFGMSRRRFFQTAAGMAAAFVAMNDTYG